MDSVDVNASLASVPHGFKSVQYCGPLKCITFSYYGISELSQNDLMIECVLVGLEAQLFCLHINLKWQCSGPKMKKTVESFYIFLLLCLGYTVFASQFIDTNFTKFPFMYITRIWQVLTI